MFINQKLQAPLPAPRKQTILLNGALNAQVMGDIRDLFEVTISSNVKEVAIDLSRVSRLDASGVGALVFLFKRLKNENRNLKIIGVHGQPEAIIRLLRLEKAIETHFSYQK